MLVDAAYLRKCDDVVVLTLTSSKNQARGHSSDV